MSILNIEPQGNEAARLHEDAGERQANNQAMIRLLNEWLADESGYDEENWAEIKKLLEENRTSSRELWNE